MTLEITLSQMIDNVIISNVGQHRKLKNGLTIFLLAHPQGYTLVLSREDVFPSDKEWETVCKHFPYSLPDVIPVAERRFGKCELRAEIPRG